MDENPQIGEPGHLRFLRLLVTVLTAVMIIGFVVLIGFLVTRFPGTGTIALPLPDQITLPEGTTPVAFTQAADWYAIVTGSDEILIYSLDGDVMQRIAVTVGQ